MKSKVIEVSFTKRIPTEDYAFEEYKLVANVDPKETGEEVLTELRKQVNNAFCADLGDTEGSSSKAEDKGDVDEETQDVDTEEIGNEEDEESFDSDSIDSEETDDEPVESEDEAEDETEEVDDEPEEKPKKRGRGRPRKTETEAKTDKEPTKKKFKKKPQAYSRSIEQHKSIFSRELTTVCPDWRKSDRLKKLARDASKELEGEDFLDDNGEVLESFLELLTEKMEG